MTARRHFIKQLSAAGLLSTMPKLLLAETKKSGDKIWACLLHLSFNFAAGIMNPKWGKGPRSEFEPEEPLWNEAIGRMSKKGVNMVVINLDDSILWDSHPEISLKNSWTPKRMHDELTKIRILGIEPIPMLNFSSTHDAWLGKYARMLSTQKYYEVCSDLINEAADLFDNPRFFHFGMDEETPRYQRHFDYIVVRQNELWWGDLYFYISEVIKRGIRPWIWSDYVWDKPEIFFKMMPKSVIQSNWYYQENFDLNQPDESNIKCIKAYIELEKEGYDQIPTGSNDQNNPKSIGNTVEFCRKNIDDKRLLGFLQTLWMPMIEKFRTPILEAIDLIGEARRKYESV
jgi:hypothetical protein